MIKANKQTSLRLKQPAEITLEQKKSLFIAAAAIVESPKEAEDFIQERKKLRPNATHHVFAYRTGIEAASRYARYSDDGEPSGTAGPPVMNVLERAGIDDACIVVTRIFGGILLGTGGLVYAYGHSASQVIEAAGKAIKQRFSVKQLRMSYKVYASMEYSLASSDYFVENLQFDSEVHFQLLHRQEQEDVLLTWLDAVGRGSIQITRLDDVYRMLEYKEEE